MLMYVPCLWFKLFSQTVQVKMMKLSHPVEHIYL